MRIVWQLLGRRQASPTTAQIGRRGEREAEKYLRARGYRSLVRNYRKGKDEIDLVLRSPERTLVFCEVRTRSAEAVVPGAFTLDRRKVAALRRVCQAYLNALGRPDVPFRFDLAEVTHEEGKTYRVAHYENVPLFSPRKRWT
jgi:putative endonuclease